MPRQYEKVFQIYVNGNCLHRILGTSSYLCFLARSDRHRAKTLTAIAASIVLFCYAL